MTKEKIFLVSPRYHTNLVPIVFALKKKYQVKILVSNFGDTESYKLVKPILCKESRLSKIIRTILKLDKYKFFIPNLFFLYSVIKEFNPKLMILRTHNRLFFYPASLIGKLLKFKIFFYDQIDLEMKEIKKNFSFLNKIKEFEFMLRNLFFQSFRITPINFSKKKNINKSFYLPFCFFSKKKRYVKKKIVHLVTVSKYHHRKNLLFLCKSILLLKQKGYKFKLSIVGEKKTIEQQQEHKKIYNFLKINKLLNEYVFLQENIKYEKMNKFYQTGDIFVLAAINEPGSISVLESMSYGMPAIVSGSCGTRCYIKKNITGRIFKDNNIKSITKEIEFFLKDTTQIKIYRDRSIKLFKKLHTIDIYLQNFNVIFKKILNN